MMRNELQTIADAEHRHAKAENRGVGGGRIGVVDRAGATGEDDADGLMRFGFRRERSAGQDYGEDILLANAAGDELCVLRAKVKDDDRRGVHCFSLL